MRAAIPVLIALALLVVARDARAEGLHVSEVLVHAASYHTDRAAGFNEFNPGLGLIARSGDSRWYVTAGGYYNSLYRPSVYAGVGLDLVSAGPFYVRAVAGVITGYAVPVAPALLPEVGVRFGRFGVAVHYVPRVESIKVAEVFAFSATWRF